MITLTPELKTQLNNVQVEANARMDYKTDLEQYKEAEHWALPTDHGAYLQGDCEDFALLKLKRLVELGWPRNELRLATCWITPNDNTSYHCVLTVDTNEGTYDLDINFHDIILWNRTGYKWHKREVPGQNYWDLIQ